MLPKYFNMVTTLKSSFVFDKEFYLTNLSTLDIKLEESGQNGDHFCQVVKIENIPARE